MGFLYDANMAPVGHCPAGRPVDWPVAQAFFTQALHQPLALTSLPPKILQDPLGAPGVPEYKLQLPQTALLSLRLVAFAASNLYPSAVAVGSDSLTASAASAVLLRSALANGAAASETTLFVMKRRRLGRQA